MLIPGILLFFEFVISIAYRKPYYGFISVKLQRFKYHTLLGLRDEIPEEDLICVTGLIDFSVCLSGAIVMMFLYITDYPLYIFFMVLGVCAFPYIWRNINDKVREFKQNTKNSTHEEYLQAKINELEKEIKYLKK